VAMVELQALQGIYAGIGGHRPSQRVHYIQAERVTWDYAPRASEGNLCGPKPVPFNPAEVSFCWNTCLATSAVGDAAGSIMVLNPTGQGAWS